MVDLNRIKVGDTVYLKPGIVREVNKNERTFRLKSGWAYTCNDFIWIREASISEHIPTPEIFYVGDIVVCNNSAEAKIIALHFEVAWCRDETTYYTLPVKSLTLRRRG